MEGSQKLCSVIFTIRRIHSTYVAQRDAQRQAHGRKVSDCVPEIPFDSAKRSMSSEWFSHTYLWMEKSNSTTHACHVE